MKLQKKNAIAGLVSVVVIVFLYFIWRTPSQYSQHLDGRQSGMMLLGEFLIENKPGEKVLVLSNPFVQKPGASSKIKDYDEMGFKGLQAGLGDRTEVRQVYPSIRADYERDPASVYIPPNSKTPLSFVVEASSLDDLAAANADFSLFVSLIGVPHGIQQLKVWDEDHPATFVFLEPDFRVLGKRSEIIRQFEKGKILAALVTDKQSGSPLIVTKSNIESVLQSQPRTLGL